MNNPSIYEMIKTSKQMEDVFDEYLLMSNESIRECIQEHTIKLLAALTIMEKNNNSKYWQRLISVISELEGSKEIDILRALISLTKTMSLKVDICGDVIMGTFNE